VLPVALRRLSSRPSSFPHLWDILRQAVRAMAVYGLICALVGVVATEVVVMLVAHALPGAFTHVTAALVCLRGGGDCRLQRAAPQPGAWHGLGRP
jgi:hypothetical protein